MSVKSKILQILEKNRNVAVSGQELADQLQVSRTAVWKAIGALKESGHQIVATTNKGYCLQADSDVLSSEGIQLHLDKNWGELEIQVYDSLDSTNSYAKKRAIEGAVHGTVILADNQTAGRGRLGRSFYSPSGSGIYMSAILRPQGSIETSIKITIAAAVAVCRAIEELTGQAPQIKWVNDIFFHGKKICGILTEGVSDFESGMVESIVVGIGVNVKTPESEFPAELQQVAGSVFPEVELQQDAGSVFPAKVSRNQLAAEILNQLFSLAENLSDPILIKEYKAYSMVLGREITYHVNGEDLQGRAVDINEEGNLIVEDTDRNQVVLRSGEVSLRSQQFI